MKEIIYFRESAIQSIMSDIGTFGIVLGSMYVGYRFMGGNGFAMCFMWFMALVAIVARAHAKKVTFTSKEALLKHINETL